MRVAFRADASLDLGTGHVMRCLTLATALKEKAVETLFICRDGPGDLGSFLERSGVQVFRLGAFSESVKGSATDGRHATGEQYRDVPWEEDAARTRSAIEEWGLLDWLVVDHYALDWKWEEALRPLAPRILAIDDLADRRHACDLLLDQNCSDDAQARYESLLPHTCEKLLGPRFSLLRTEFARARASSVVRDGGVHRLFVFFGGADSSNETTKALEAIRMLGRRGLQVDVVIGETNIHKTAVEAACDSQEATSLHVQSGNIAALMAAADLAVGAGGGALLERCALSLPSIVMAIAPNQMNGCEALARAGAIVFLGAAESLTAEDLRESIEALLKSPSRLSEMSLAAGRVLDGSGVERVAQSLLDGAIRMRRAKAADCDDVWAWRNAESTRQFSLNSAPLNLESHRLWFDAVLRDRDRDLLIAEDGSGPIGVGRFDVASHGASISVYLVPARRGQGLGSSLITAAVHWIREYRPTVHRILAEILPRNLPSIRAFERAGFRPGESNYELHLRGD